MNLKVLIVEDETIVALDIRQVLLSLNLIVSNIVTNYYDAIKEVQKDEPDLILMDINLQSQKDGIQTARDIQKIKNIPIIYLTAFSDEETINRAIETNPLHYMLKPFKRAELRSNIQLALYKIEKRKNHPAYKKHFFNVGNGYYYDTQNEGLYYHDMPMKLGVKERKLLSILISAKGNIVSFNELVYEIWPDELVSDSTLRTLIYRLRTKLEHRIIETIPAFGCKLTPVK